ncbi:hypothetical protein EDD18DRAFT_1107751 [Armillaria luteobubalina]|uniref:Uncharacterized protein n=1 Tax=Armillaria luteobubalina TaxID=153913 RepID=A0AA39Q2T4_9AGAR|nr:hypothetical protein EDD18DRAFT_1107751 [Armillaria luteobubalina]
MIKSLVNILMPFFPPTTFWIFTVMQQQTGLLIRGEHTMSFFTDDIPDSDLHLFVEFYYREPIISFLMRCGYSFTPLQGQPADVYEVDKMCRDDDANFVTDRRPPRNTFTYNARYTSALHFAMSFKGQHYGLVDILEKKGFKYVDRTHAQYEDLFYPDVEDTDEDINPWFMANTWMLVEHDIGGIWMETGLFELSLLRHSYCIAGALICKLDTIVAVLMFRHNQLGKIMQIILTKGTPVYSILQFHSMCVMNFIMYGHAVSLYPKATFLKKRSAYSYNIKSSVDMSPVDKYKAQGIIYEDNNVNNSYKLYYPGINWRIGDDYSWMIDLRPEDGSDRVNPLIANTWRIMGCDEISGFWIDAGIMHAGRLDESYTIASTAVYLIYPDTEM